MNERSKFGGMTVNERLVAARVIEDWDRAVHARDRDAMIGILKKVDLPQSESGRIADTILANPARYGLGAEMS